MDLVLGVVLGLGIPVVMAKEDINAEAQAEQPYDRFVVSMRNVLAKKNAMNIMGNGIKSLMDSIIFSIFILTSMIYSIN